jgi:hypothetical protein
MLHEQVQDFSWVRGGQSPNWSILGSGSITTIRKYLQGAENGGIGGLLSHLGSVTNSQIDET